MKLSIVIPVYNEKDTILKLVEKVKKVDLGKIKKEIVIVDDFSNDGTRNLLKEIKDPFIKVILNSKNNGKGFALRTAFDNVSGDFIIIQDADFEYDPEDYIKLIEVVQKGDFLVVYGSRFLGNNKIKWNSFYFGNRILSLVTSLFYFKKITDMETCYKLFKKDLLKDISLKSNGFEIEPEITSKFLKKGYNIFEVPVSYSPRTMEQGKKIKAKDGVIALWNLLKYRFSY
jgi:dolichol-phosphate mannosyltransferase